MAPRYDKYDGVTGGFRAKLAADLTVDAEGSTGVKAVSLNASGRVVIGTAGQSGFVGVFIKNIPAYPGLGNIAGGFNLAVPIGGKAADVVDVMTDGEIVDVTGLVAGTRYYATAAGGISTTVVAGALIGWTVEATRLIVRVGRG
jgi:hypothetical protein